MLTIINIVADGKALVYTLGLIFAMFQNIFRAVCDREMT